MCFSLFVGTSIYSAAPPRPPPPPPPPPVVRPKKPPRLLQYAQQTLNRHSINVALNTSIKTSHEKTVTSSNGFTTMPQDSRNTNLRATNTCKY